MAAAASVRDLRCARRRNRLADFDVVDVVYQAYVTVLVGAVVASYAVEMIGDDRLTPSTVTELMTWGPPVVGAVMAGVVGWALRSGAAGGPLVIEAGDVHHLLLAPVDRASVLRPAAVVRFRVAASRGAAVGGLAGFVAAQRLPGGRWAWVLTGAAVVSAVGLGGTALALVASGLRLSRRSAALAAPVVLSVAVADVVDPRGRGPFALVGEVMLWPIARPGPGAAIILGLIVTSLTVLALACVGGISLERAERRAGLVSQLRFAAVMRDLRAVILLRRQLAQERSRVRPWIRVPLGRRRAGAVAKRDLHGGLRWPAARVVRVAGLAAGAGLAAAAAGSGTTEALVVAGLLAWLVALEAIDGLGQVVDRPDLRATLARRASGLVFSHLVVAAGVTVIAAAIAAGAATSLASNRGSAALVAALTALPAVLCSVSAAAVSVVRGPPAPFDLAHVLLPPEVIGAAMVQREALPPAVATIGFLPVLAAQDGVVGVTEIGVAAAGALVVPALVTIWLATRGQARL